MARKSGILLPIFSLPNDYGIGSFGKESYQFIDFLKRAGQKVWQILPLVQTGYGNSPYSSVSAESLNPFFISIEELCDQGLITSRDLKTCKYNGKYIDYAFINNTRYPILRKAFKKFNKKDENFKAFIKSKKAYDYALYMSIKKVTNYKPLCDWEDGLKFRDKNTLKAFEKENKAEVLFWQFVQYEANRQWEKLHKYANENNIMIMGDMPLYVALDSVDVWKNPNLFKIDRNFTPVKVAGVPPDYFSKTGQLWGNPVYDYEKNGQVLFDWWTERLSNALTNFDYVRIDHFRGLDRYYEVDYGREDAMVGEWIQVPCKKLFNAIHQKIEKDRIIAEDLGIIDDGVRKLLKFTGYPGMKILSFAFNGEPNNLYLPENIGKNSVCYTGTHDNDTLFGLINHASDWDYNNMYYGVKNSLSLAGIEREVSDKQSLAKAMIELGFYCKANLFILPLSDALLFDSDYRINEPGTVQDQNWSIKFEKENFDQKLEKQLKSLTKKYKR